MRVDVTLEAAHALVRLANRGENDAPWPNDVVEGFARALITCSDQLERTTQLAEELRDRWDTETDRAIAAEARAQKIAEAAHAFLRLTHGESEQKRALVLALDEHAFEPPPDLFWRMKMSGLLLELTGEVKALTEVVHTMAVKLAASEQAAPRDSGKPQA